MPGLLRGIGRTAAIAGTASAVGGRVRHRQERRWAEQEAPPAEAPAAAPPPAAGGASTIEQLKQLGELRAQGVLTEDEFAAQKAKVLAG
jgi:putative oligomerization/nucleic acid binding protein